MIGLFYLKNFPLESLKDTLGHSYIQQFKNSIHISNSPHNTIVQPEHSHKHGLMGLYKSCSHHTLRTSTLTSMDSDEEIFLTQNKFREGQSSGEDTDAVLNDILDLEAEGSNITFDLKLDMFSHISDDDLVKHSDRIVMETQRENISVNSKCKEKENARFIEPISDGERENNSKSRFSTKTELKSKWAVNLFNSWLRNRREKYAYRSDICTVEGELLTMDSDTLNYSLGAFITEIRKENGDDYHH